MVNINKLKGKIIENGLTVEKIAELIGINKSTLYRKLNNNGNDITIKEAEKIYKTLKLSNEEAISIFFA